MKKDLLEPPQQQTALPSRAARCSDKKILICCSQQVALYNGFSHPPSSLKQLKLSKVQHYRTCGIKRTLGSHRSAERERGKKTCTPRHQFIFTLTMLSGISRSCSHLLNLYEILAGWELFQIMYPRQQG